ncbi:hypothetical protein QZH41_006910 [Actinostola sp. cb2023]|nr:hypothetical protein QZH41_006910 [Actinostola sp. cb2023]
MLPVKSNAVRALGNFLNYAKPSTLELLHNFIQKRFFLQQADVFNALTNVIQDCKNFKVRINAVVPLSVPCQRHCYGDAVQFLSIVEVLVKVLDLSSTLTEFSEYKYQENLQEQLCNTLCHLISLTTEEDLGLLHPVLDQNTTVLHFLTEHVTSVTSKNTIEGEEHDEAKGNTDDNDPSTKRTSNAETSKPIKSVLRIESFSYEWETNGTELRSRYGIKDIYSTNHIIDQPIGMLGYGMVMAS